MNIHVPTVDFIIFRDAVEELVSSFHCEDGPPQAIAPNGKMYVEITSYRSQGGDEREPDTVHFSLEAALADWTHKMRTYLAGKSRIWWRIRPEFDIQDGIYVRDYFGDVDGEPRPRPQYKIYARLMAEP